MNIQTPTDVQRLFPVRKSRKQKDAFRECVTDFLTSLGYTVTIEKGSFGSRNVVIGDPKRAKYLITAHYDTCARMLIPNLITPCNFFAYLLYQILVALLLLVPGVATGMLVGVLLHSADVGFYTYFVLIWVSIFMLLIGPANPSNANDNTSGVVTVLEIARTLPKFHRDQVCFILFDLEEAGLIGSSSYQKKHKKETLHQLVLNLDCVGEGDTLMLFPTGKLKKQRQKMQDLNALAGTYGRKSIALRDHGFAIYPSDQAHFPYGVGICALNKSRLGLYLSRIHTPRDTILDETNVNLLRDALTDFVAGTAAQ